MWPCLNARSFSFAPINFDQRLGQRRPRCCYHGEKMKCLRQQLRMREHQPKPKPHTNPGGMLMIVTAWMNICSKGPSSGGVRDIKHSEGGLRAKYDISHVSVSKRKDLKTFLHITWVMKWHQSEVIQRVLGSAQRCFQYLGCALDDLHQVVVHGAGHVEDERQSRCPLRDRLFCGCRDPSVLPGAKSHWQREVQPQQSAAHLRVEMLHR